MAEETLYDSEAMRRFAGIELGDDRILVAHDGDMKGLAKRHGVTNGRFKSLSLLKLSCSEPRAVDRLRQAMSLIEHEWQVSQQKRARRLYVEIGTEVIRTFR